MSVHTKDSLMEQAQVFASWWSIVGGPFDDGYSMEGAVRAKAELAEIVGEVVQQRDQLLAALTQISAIRPGSASPRLRRAVQIAEAAIAAAERLQGVT